MPDKQKKKSKRVTMKDVALEAGVSTATVSFVLNYSNEEKISHDTRLRVFEAAQKLNYVPDLSARNLARQRHAGTAKIPGSLAGVIINLGEENLRSKLYLHFDLVNELQRQLHVIGCDTLFLPTRDIERDLEVGSRWPLKSVFIIDMDSRQSKILARNFYVPIIFIDAKIDDLLFREILVDYDRVFSLAVGRPENSYIVLEEYANDYVYNSACKICSPENVYINRKGGNLAAFLEEKKDMQGVVVGEILGLQVESIRGGKGLTVIVGTQNHCLTSPYTKTILVRNHDKAKAAVDIMEKLTALQTSDVPQVTYISPYTQP